MNILENIKFDSDKPHVHFIRKDNKANYFAIALGENAILKKHTAPVPSHLVITKGSINFRFSDRNYILKAYDIFEIPQDEEHEVIGIEK